MTYALTESSARASQPTVVSRQPSSDLLLIARIACGDQLAMRSLLARHQVPVYRFILRFLRDEALAEDVLSEVFLDVWRQAGRFEVRSSVSTWLLAIARYKALSARRRRVDAELDEHTAERLVDTTDTPEAALVKKDNGKILRRCLSQLSPEHSEIIDLAYYHGKSVAEVAEIVGIPEATVKTRMFYARRKLAQLVQAT